LGSTSKRARVEVRTSAAASGAGTSARAAAVAALALALSAGCSSCKRDAAESYKVLQYLNTYGDSDVTRLRIQREGLAEEQVKAAYELLKARR